MNSPKNALNVNHHTCAERTFTRRLQWHGFRANHAEGIMFLCIRNFTAVLVVATIAACASGGGSAGEAGLELHAESDAGSGVEDFVLVDCLLPGQIRKLGTMMTYLTPRRSAKATQRDCAIRGGEFVLFDRSDYATALGTLLPKAQAGDVIAQSYVGEIYERGLGLPGPDYAEAVNWYRKAAEGGDRAAQTSLGSLYERGLGVPKDKAAALNWYRRATGLTKDPLVFESAFDAQREAFQREIALRNRLADSLRRQLTRSEKIGGADASPASLSTIATSQRRDAERAAELREKALHAVKEIRNDEERAGEASKAKSARAGKLELSLRQQRDELLSTSERLAGP